MTKRQSKIIEYAVVALIIGALLALLVPPPSSDRGPWHTTRCRNNLRMVGLALVHYRGAYGTYPPAYLVDATGEPMHNWRVILLPFLDMKDVYDAYRFAEPWNSPHNAKVQDDSERRLAMCFSCSGDWKDMKQSASYLAVVGQHAAWPGSRGRNKSFEFGNGLANTIMLVEVAHSGIGYFEPRDLEYDKMCFGVNDPSDCGIRSEHLTRTYWTQDIKTRFAHVLYADGTVGELPDTTPPRVVRALLTVDGDEKVSRP